MFRIVPRALAALSFATPAPASRRASREGPCALADGTYRARLPDRARRGVVLYAHGWGGTPAGALRSETRVDPMVARGYAVIAPQGLPRWAGDAGDASSGRALT